MEHSYIAKMDGDPVVIDCLYDNQLPVDVLDFVDKVKGLRIINMSARFLALFRPRKFLRASAFKKV